MSTAFEPHWVQRPGTAVSRVFQPKSLVGAARLLAEDTSRRLVAGGTDLVVDLARSSGEPVELIDLSRVHDSGEIEPFTPQTTSPGYPESMHGRAHLVLGSMVTHNQVVSSRVIVERAFPLAQACLEIGSPQLRNRATIAGNLATASPANDSISALLALDATVQLFSAERGIRFVPLTEFFEDVRATVMAPDELITSTCVPEMTDRQRGVWVKAGLRKAQAISVVHLGIVVEFEEADPRAPIVGARLALGSVAPTVVLATDAAQALIGQQLDADTIGVVAHVAAAEVTPIGDGRATAEYRTATVATTVRRALEAIASGAERSRWPARIPTLQQSNSVGSSSMGSQRMGSQPNRPPALTFPRPAPPLREIDDVAEISVTINGEARMADSAASLTLLDWLRKHQGTGTKEGCAEGECGACTVLLDGHAVMSCLTPAAQAQGAEVTTVEGLAVDPALSAMQQSFVDSFAVQCGYCIPGFIVSATALCDELDAPDREEMELGLAGNLCRCTGYYAILEAVYLAGQHNHTNQLSAAGDDT